MDEQEAPRRLKLTALGRFVVAFGTLTTPKWWQALYQEVDYLNNEDEELGLFMLEERIARMQQMRQDWYRLVNDVDPDGQVDDG